MAPQPSSSAQGLVGNAPGGGNGRPTWDAQGPPLLAKSAPSKKGWRPRRSKRLEWAERLPTDTGLLSLLPKPRKFGGFCHRIS